MRCNMNLSTNFREPPFRVEISPWLKHMYSILTAFTWRPMLPIACSSICSKVSAWAGVICKKCYVIYMVCVHTSFRWVSSASCLFLVQSHFLLLDLSTFEVHNLRRLWMDMVLKYPLQNSSNNGKEVCVSIWWANLGIHVTIEHHYGCDSFFEGTIS